ncbi:MAG: DNA gyrase inhibitor YacG [Sedimentisphaerales bacterium]|nr:DNA gyrase inhibitor YacG [Sedimentisphaerales bacterium]
MGFNCPICGKNVEKRAKDEAFFPFCSQRCKLVDLNAWLESEYIISNPIEEDEDNEPENMLK